MREEVTSHVQEGCLITPFALTRPLALQTEAVTVSAGGFLPTTAYLFGPALVAH